MKSLPLLSSVGLGLLLAVPAIFADADSTVPQPAWTLGTGFNYSKGDYGFAADTEYFSAPLNLGYDNGTWMFRASVPWVTIKGPAANTGGGGVPRPTTASESGLGDIFASATYRMGRILGPIQAAFTGRVKFPTADEARGLGTGETDTYGQFDFYRVLGSTTPFVSLGYRFLGDSAVYQLEDGVYASAGSHIRTSASTVLTVAVNWSEPYVAGGDASTDALVSVTHDLNESWQLSGYALKGFTDASPDHGAGLQMNYRF
jgi:hypothetical protein